MRGRTLIGITVALVVVAGVATLAQDPTQPDAVDSVLPKATEDPPGLEPAADVLEAPPAPGAASVPDDPMEDVEGFIQRNREEAAGKIAMLTEERERLRERLRKVEAALAKWSAVNEALERGNAAEVGPQEFRPEEVPPTGVVVPPPVAPRP